MQTIFAQRARLPQGWAENLRLTVDNGRIASVETGAGPQPGDARADVLLPSLGNLHSHSFQRAMAGMTEYRAAGKDSFWTWRELMYRFMDCITPEQYEAIAALVFMEMLEAGYASVGEFHYVHHQPGGAHFASMTELSERVFAAASQTGIGLTHLPVLYTYGGAGKQELSGGQQRFGNSVADFSDHVSRARGIAARDLPADTCVGIAPHSLRATCPEDLAEVLRIQDRLPVHIHIAEQPKEVADISDWLGARPVEWLLENARRGWQMVPDPRHPHDQHRNYQPWRGPVPLQVSVRSQRRTWATGRSTGWNTWRITGHLGLVQTLTCGYRCQRNCERWNIPSG